jgi:DNA-directed DNA polymerase III PolC
MAAGNKGNGLPEGFRIVFVPLHVKSDYSFGCGTASVDELVAHAAMCGFTSLALTDLENLCGQVRFHHQCRNGGLHPVTGIELRPAFDGRRSIGGRSGRLVLLARNRTGYRSLCRIVSRRRGVAGPRGGKGRLGRDPLPLVVEHADGLFVLSDEVCVLERLIDAGISRQKLKLLVVRPGEAGSVHRPADAARRLGVRLVADIDAIFLDEGDHPLHLLQLAVRKGVRVKEASEDPSVESSKRRLRTPEEAEALFSDLPEALSETEAIAEACRLDLGPGHALFAAAETAGDPESAERLRSLCGRAVEQRRTGGKTWTADYGRRLETELSTFERMGFSDFFSIVAEILTHCRDRSIPVVARGSAVSSLALHILGASPVDPVDEGLLFERFLNTAKSEWPDVDLDIPWHRRDEVIGWVYGRFGPENAAMVAAHHRFQHRSALREGLKALGARPADIDAVSRMFPPEELGTEDTESIEFFRTLQEGDSTAAGGFGRRLPESIAKALPLVWRLVGRPHHMAAHPGGIVIGRTPLEDLLPLERAPKGVVITQFDMAATAALGMIKIDLLGNRCLSELQETLRLAGGSERLESIPSEDPPALALVDRADTVGCFQLETPAMRSLLARLPIRRRSDIVAALALIRPGAAAGAAKDAFVARARREAPTELFDPALSDRIGETHGLLLYEEDIMVLLSRTGGLSLAESDRLRSEIVRSGGDSEILAGLEEEFLKKARSNDGTESFDPARARRAFAAAVRFAAYSFNKAHAASYGHLAYLSAYMKVHYPIAFSCALLNHHQGIYPLRTLAAELIRSGVEIRPPHVNFSDYRSSLEKRTHHRVRVGLDKIRTLSYRCAGRILNERTARGPFIGLNDILQRVNPTVRELKALILSGACDGLPPLAAERYPFSHEAAMELLRKEKAPIDPGRIRLVDLPESPVELARFELYQALVRARNELRYLEMHLTAHPVALLRPEAERYGSVSIRTAVSSEEGSLQRLFAVVAAMRRVPVRKGIIQFFTLEDETGLLEAAVLPAAYNRLGDRIPTPGPFLVDGVLRKRQGAVHLEVSGIKPFHQRRQPFKEHLQPAEGLR